VQAIHINAGLDTSEDVSFIEAALRMLAGVADVAAVRSLGIISVLYDERKITPRTILREIRATGFDARFMRPGAINRKPLR
jgi:copper chaperone CopZ